MKKSKKHEAAVALGKLSAAKRKREGWGPAEYRALSLRRLKKKPKVWV